MQALAICCYNNARVANLKPKPNQCGSGLARECGRSVTISGDWHTAFASKPAPTFDFQRSRGRVRHITTTRPHTRPTVEIPPATPI
ncbi:hypothetical protein FFI16_024695 [Pseudomonas sp. KBS0710]|nr:hypothetical protein FFI16_024695 [Pseudomonas sp. KBS0710]